MLNKRLKENGIKLTEGMLETLDSKEIDIELKEDIISEPKPKSFESYCVLIPGNIRKKFSYRVPYEYISLYRIEKPRALSSQDYYNKESQGEYINFGKKDIKNLPYMREERSCLYYFMNSDSENNAQSNIGSKSLLDFFFTVSLVKSHSCKSPWELIPVAVTLIYLPGIS